MKLLMGVVAIATGAVAGVLVSCGASPSESQVGSGPLAAEMEEAQPTVATPGVTSATVSDYPAGALIDHVLLLGRSLSDVEDEVQQRTADCMVGKGWEWYSPVDATIVMGSEDPTLSVEELAERRSSRGYGFVWERQGSLDADPNRSTIEQLTSAEVERLTVDLGDSGGAGCRGTAEKAVYRSIPWFDPGVSSVGADIAAALLATPAFGEAQRHWSLCMTAAGYATPSEEKAKLAQQARDAVLAGDPAQIADVLAREVAMAVSDAECYATHVVPVRSGIEARLLDAAVADGLLTEALWPGSLP